jgi:hypothetical protein
MVLRKFLYAVATPQKKGEREAYRMAEAEQPRHENEGRDS